jgi:putative transposase
MKRKRHPTGEIIRILRKADEGQSVEEACREVNISEETFYRWRRKYGRMEMADAKRFKVLEKENVELKKMLTLIDKYSRQCLKIEVGRKLKSKEVLDALAEAMAKRGLPRYIRSENGPEFIARDAQNWLDEMGMGTIDLEPGSPWQNPFVESFHNRLRDECLNQEIFLSVTEARIVIEEWRRCHNRLHLHSGLGFQSPDDFARNVAQLEPVPGT